MAKQGWGVQQMSHLPDSHIRQPCMCARQREEGGTRRRGWANNENKSKEEKKTAEATFEWSSGVHTARTLRAPRGVNMTRERMQGRSLSLGDVNILPRLLTRRSSLKTHSSCPLDSVRHALCSAFGAQNYVVESRMKCTCMDCTFHAHLFPLPIAREQSCKGFRNHGVKKKKKKKVPCGALKLMPWCTRCHDVQMYCKFKKKKKQTGGLLNIKICRQLLFESLALHLTRERFAFGVEWL